ncbi:MAG: ribosomal subunit interface protein [Candidatus Tagabacteria bacterium CG09_land_8_20_14_0_10_41_14]|uniref:Ribosomal subunit interface protein n=1 Tax=Candidatus Tagabacteria bacterium CG09_land_8_20_14_0_10_41_14 TaxID=1975021 RepID=A0A2H0WL63_9BACT|nr:MAG: ribosomal subunit interface protein [Candidatus Tagabacteria bacterium CG09_land_8_20_14_0_10_41_14]
MEIIFKSKNFELTSSIEDYVRKKIETLGKFLKNFNQEIIKFEVEVGRTTHHYKSGDIFRAEINLSLGGRLLRVESEREDLFTAIDETRDDLEQEIKKFKTKKGAIFIRGARSIKKKFGLSDLARFKK